MLGSKQVIMVQEKSYLLLGEKNVCIAQLKGRAQKGVFNDKLSELICTYLCTMT